MKSLAIQSTQIRKQERRLIFATAAAVGAIAVLGYWPARARIGDLKDRTRDAEAELVENRALADRLPNVVKEVEGMRSNLALIRRRELPDSVNVGDFINQTEAIAAQQSLKYDYEHGPLTRAQSHSEKDFQLKLKGDFVNLYGFLRDLEELPRLLRVSRLKIRAADQPGQVEADVTVKLYFREPQ